MSLNRAIQRELDSFFQKIDSSDYTIREVTKGAFSQARLKLNEWGFIRFNTDFRSLNFSHSLFPNLFC